METKFRGQRVDNGEMVYGYYRKNSFYNNLSDEPKLIYTKHFIGAFDNLTPFNGIFEQVEVIPETVGQFTGLKDKNGVEVYKGDVIRFKRPYRTTQTHTGDNIPNGSYTEPKECAIEINEHQVIYNAPSFGIIKKNGENIPLDWIDINYDLESLKDAVCWRDWQKDIFDDPDEGDLGYLLETYNLKDLDELLNFINGIEVIGNVHANPELLTKTAQ